MVLIKTGIKMFTIHIFPNPIEAYKYIRRCITLTHPCPNRGKIFIAKIDHDPGIIVP